MRKSISFKISGGDPSTGVGGTLILNEDVLTYHAFREVYEADQTPTKTLAFMDLKYVKLMGEEVGAFSHKHGHERKFDATMEAYDTPNPVLTPERRALRDAALKFFMDTEETEEGQTLYMLKGRVQVIKVVIKATEKDASSIKTDEDLLKYMNSSETQTTALLKLTTAIGKVEEQITRNGGRKKTKNVADAATTPNERGDFAPDAVKARLQARGILTE